MHRKCGFTFFFNRIFNWLCDIGEMKMIEILLVLAWCITGLLGMVMYAYEMARYYKNRKKVCIQIMQEAPWWVWIIATIGGPISVLTSLTVPRGE